MERVDPDAKQAANLKVWHRKPIRIGTTAGHASKSTSMQHAVGHKGLSKASVEAPYRRHLPRASL
jgi:hypothetical protein